MRVEIAVAAAVVVALAGCSKQGSPSPPAPSSTADPFPQKGMYHVIHDVMQGSETKREESDRELDVSDRGKFADELAKDDGSNCRDKNVTIGNGSFSVHMICDAPDGDIHNIGLDRFGSYSKDSIDLTTQTTLWGQPFQEHYSFRLTDS